MLKITKNKKGSSIPLVILVLGLFIASGIALMTFYKQKNSMTQDLSPLGTMNEIYNSEEQVRFYVDYSIKEAINETKNKEEITALIRQKLVLGEEKIPELKQITQQLNSIIITEKMVLKTKFYVTIQKRIIFDGKELAIQSHEFMMNDDYPLETFINKKELN